MKETELNYYEKDILYNFGNKKGNMGSAPKSLIE